MQNSWNHLHLIQEPAGVAHSLSLVPCCLSKARAHQASQPALPLLRAVGHFREGTHVLICPHIHTFPQCAHKHTHTYKHSHDVPGAM